ncbi:hypothetical protein [Vibrio phage vB_VmeM-Yong XC32]|nr:hypothetical protein [Vibrio phage vB_VmeM-Yong XC31]QAX96403.1 hypothetical protein [Vibrio phage vB_VmeM-Yong XC32]QAX96720.1 hypothetical protein [Vibrio phage vB_VmeM-Yong MS31]QAX97039.1 hypothetical protein [Vibrio phage vB_VmeM-Yong MS32]
MLKHRIKKLSEVSSNDEHLWAILGLISTDGELKAETVKCEFWSTRAMVATIGKTNVWIGEKSGEPITPALPRVMNHVYSATTRAMGLDGEEPFARDRPFLLLFRKKKQAEETISSGQLEYHVKLALRLQHREEFLAALDRSMITDCMYCGEHLRDCDCNADAAFGDGMYNGTEPPKFDDAMLDRAVLKPMPCGKPVLNPHIGRED